MFGSIFLLVEPRQVTHDLLVSLDHDVDVVHAELLEPGCVYRLDLEGVDVLLVATEDVLNM